MPPRSYSEIEGSRNITLPLAVAEEAREHAHQAGVTMRGYIDAAHGVMFQLGQVGVGPDTRICTPQGLAPLPNLRVEPQPTRTIGTIIGKKLLEQSYDYRQAKQLTLSQYVGRTVLLMNGLFQLNIGSELRLERTLQPPHRASFVLPFTARVRI